MHELKHGSHYDPANLQNALGFPSSDETEDDENEQTSDIMNTKRKDKLIKCNKSYIISEEC